MEFPSSPCSKQPQILSGGVVSKTDKAFWEGSKEPFLSASGMHFWIKAQIKDLFLTLLTCTLFILKNENCLNLGLGLKALLCRPLETGV